jgi:DtxR family Mn-dependent transcriptional regulator
MTRDHDHSQAVEDYLLELWRQETAAGGEGQPVPNGELATALGVSPPSVTAMLRRLHAEGLVEQVPYRGSTLTLAGRRVALRMLRRHRLLETFLHVQLGLDWGEVHDEAHALEHVVSDRLLARVDAVLGHPTHDPHGDPIPDADGNLRVEPTRALADCARDERLRLVSIHGNDPALLAYLGAEGLRPGVQLLVVSPLGPAGAMQVARLDGGRAAAAVPLGGEQAKRLRVAVVEAATAAPAKRQARAKR